MNSTTIIEKLEQQLSLRYVSDIAGGHTAATLVQMERSDGIRLVAKFCKPTAPGGCDISENMSGYTGIKGTGAVTLLPQDYSVETVLGLPVMLMRYMEPSFKAAAFQLGMKCYETLRNSLANLTQLTARFDSNGQYGQRSIEETFRYLQFFGNEISGLLPDGFLDLIQKPLSVPFSERAGLFLLDFTPDNVFLAGGDIRFIDPWKQSTYLGYTGISLGQFITLARDIYDLPGSEVGSQMLMKFAFGDLARMLGSHSETIGRTLDLGAALQFVLSAYVRRSSDSRQAIMYGRKAFAALKRMLS